VLVCQARAAAHGRHAVGRFADPTALPLLRAEERAVVEAVREEKVPDDLGDRLDYEMVKATSLMMVVRTVAIDDAVRAHRSHQLVILGAGLDGRAWRLPELAAAEVYEVDQPASQRDKRERAGALQGAAPRYVPVDFGRDDLAAALREAGHHAGTPTTWIWEGVVPYLTAAEVETTVAAIAACSAAGSRLIVNYQIPLGAARAWRLVSRLLHAVAGRRTVWAREPWRSSWTPAAMAALLARHGFAVSQDDDLLTLAASVPLDVSALGTGRRASMSNGRFAVADR
jgi:methyltransferase (TIGR00027 family)